MRLFLLEKTIHIAIQNHINAEIYRTDIDGTILVITDGKNIQIKTNN